MKKLTALILLLSVLLLGACAGDGNGNSSFADGSETSSAQSLESLDNASDGSEDESYADEDSEGEASESENSETQEPEVGSKPIFYKVTGENGGTLYFLGSIHVADGSAYPFPSEIEKAYESSDFLAVEADVYSFESDLEAQVELMQKMVLLDGTTISDHLGAELYQRAKTALEEAGLYSSYLDYYSPAFWFSMLQSAGLGDSELESEFGIDYHFLKLATESGKEIREIESVEEQYDMMIGFSPELLKILIDTTVSELKTAEEDINELYSLWKTGDEETIANALSYETEIPEGFVENKVLYDEYVKAMSTDRNVKMTETAKNYLSEGKTGFVVVGLAHVIGEGGIAEALRNEGYSVERISFE